MQYINVNEILHLIFLKLCFTQHTHSFNTSGLYTKIHPTGCLAIVL